MIVTVTPNPSVDRTIFVDDLPRGEVIRSRRSRQEPSGKGVNVALALRAEGYPALAVLPVGGLAGRQLLEMIGAAGLAHVAVPIAGDIRSNISLVEPDGTVTKINEAGPRLSAAEAAALVAATLGETGTMTWLAGCGSLPAGAGSDLYQQLAAEGRRRGVKVAIDTSGVALDAVLPYRPHLVKPNVHELAEAVTRPLETVGDVVDAADQIRRRGADAVLASMGPDGAVLVDADGAVHATTPPAPVASTVGAGDALLAGFLAGGGTGPHALRLAMVWAAAAVQDEGTLHARHAPAVEVTLRRDVDRRRRLSDRSGPPIVTSVRSRAVPSAPLHRQPYP